MIIYSKTKADFINDVFNNVLVDELVESLKAKKVPGTGPAHIRSHQNSLRFMDTVLHDAAIPDNAGIAIEYVNPNPAGHGRIPRSSGSRAKRYARQAREGVCRPERVPAMRGESFSRNFPAIPSGETKSRISSLFCGSGKYTATPKDTFDMLVVDEAHRLNEKSGMMQNQGENQVKEIINSAKCSVFFLDEDQKVTRPLPQGYLAWLDNTLQKRETANTQLGAEEYDFRVVDSAAGLRDLIFERNKLSNKARLVAGYCWDDSSVRGYNRKLAADPAAARLEMDALIKNTYKTYGVIIRLRTVQMSVKL